VNVHRRFLSSVALGILGLGCAPHTDPNAAPVAAGLTGGLGPETLQWSGSFQAVQQQSGDMNAPRGRNNARGSVVIIAEGKNAIRARINVSDVSGSAQYYHWALVGGRCGSGQIPQLTVSQFPDISMSNNQGHVDGTVPLPLPTSGTYHVNVYRTNGGDEADVLTCANLRIEPRKE
jgi:hypothetical protein